MRILHTSDWHLGKNLEGYSRMDEQEKFLEDFSLLVDEKNIDMVIIAGDIYDNSNPPARAENMFYKSLKEITSNGKRAILVIAGNHDNPDRLSAASPIAYDQGIFLLGTPKSIIPKGQYGNFTVVDSGEGFLEIEINGEKAVILTLPYPSEKRLNEILSDNLEDEERRKSYSDRIGEIFKSSSTKFREDTINIAVSHIFVLGGETSESERPIELGGSLAVEVKNLPDKAQYIALGHLHKPQAVNSKRLKAFYSGSPLQYSKSEIGYSKLCYVVDLKPSEEAVVEKTYFNNYKPIEVWKCKGIEDALNKCELNKDKSCWVYLEIESETYISQENIKKIRDLKADIIEIKPKIKGLDEEEAAFDSVKEKSMKELFKDYYFSERGKEPDSEIMDLFLEIACEDGEEDETKDTES
ncbi:MAG: exonuclease SbcCD subunit D [Bacillota bacterium]|nr:exonuclease SbcCD subunit D [Bacillota bacterium]